MRFVEIDPLNDSRYDEFINANQSATIFHTSNWIRLLHCAYHFTPHSIAVENEGRICGILPFITARSITGVKRYITLPFSDFCEPLLDGSDTFDAVFREFVKKATMERCHFVEIRGAQRFFKNAQCFDSIYTHDIDLRGNEETLFKSFRNSTQRNIKKASREGISVVHCTSSDVLKSFYRLNCITRKKHGLPSQPWFFFKGLQSEILLKNKGFISCAIADNTVIAANVYLFHNKNALYKYGASDPRYQQLRPNNLLMWEGMKHCKEIGCTTINLGRTETDHIGLLQFKRGFGCKESILNYYHYSISAKSFIKKPDFPKTDILKTFNSKLPIPILKFAGFVLYKYFG